MPNLKYKVTVGEYDWGETQERVFEDIYMSRIVEDMSAYILEENEKLSIDYIKEYNETIKYSVRVTKVAGLGRYCCKITSWIERYPCETCGSTNVKYRYEVPPSTSPDYTWRNSQIDILNQILEYLLNDSGHSIKVERLNDDETVKEVIWDSSPIIVERNKEIMRNRDKAE